MTIQYPTVFFHDLLYLKQPHSLYILSLLHDVEPNNSLNKNKNCRRRREKDDEPKKIAEEEEKKDSEKKGQT